MCTNYRNNQHISRIYRPALLTWVGEISLRRKKNGTITSLIRLISETNHDAKFDTLHFPTVRQIGLVDWTYTKIHCKKRVIHSWRSGWAMHVVCRGFDPRTQNIFVWSTGSSSKWRGSLCVWALKNVNSPTIQEAL